MILSQHTPDPSQQLCFPFAPEHRQRAAPLVRHDGPLVGWVVGLLSAGLMVAVLVWSFAVLRGVV